MWGPFYVISPSIYVISPTLLKVYTLLISFCLSLFLQRETKYSPLKIYYIPPCIVFFNHPYWYYKEIFIALPHEDQLILWSHTHSHRRSVTCDSTLSYTRHRAGACRARLELFKHFLWVNKTLNISMLLTLKNLYITLTTFYCHYGDPLILTKK